MVKSLLVCSAGMSTSFMVNKMKDAAKARGIEAEIWAVADAEAEANIANADIMMLGPQVRFLESKMKGIAGGKSKRYRNKSCKKAGGSKCRSMEIFNIYR